MKISLRNIGLIKKADVDINGIAVIAGKNNTGKSTVAKSLYSIFNAFYNIDDKIVDDIKKNLYNIESRFILRRDRFVNRYKINNEFIIENIKKKTIKNVSDLNELIERTENNSVFDDIADEDKERWESYKKLMSEILNIPPDEIKKRIIKKHFQSEFNGQINSIYEKEGVVCIQLKDKNIELSFKGNDIFIDKEETAITEEATYIENSSFILNNIANNPFFLDERYHDDNLVLKLILKERIPLNTLVELHSKQDIDTKEKEENFSMEILNEKKLENIYKKLNGVVNGNIVRNNSGNIVYKSKNGNEFYIKNISTGLKTFIVIKELLIQNYMQYNGVLILDEPEIHLHPELQLTFAELVVLLQKEFNLHILLSTHSPYFLKAIEVYSKKHNISDKCKYYLTNDSNENSITIDDVTDKTYEIYGLLAEPYNELHEIENELDNVAQ